MIQIDEKILIQNKLSPNQYLYLERKLTQLLEDYKITKREIMELVVYDFIDIDFKVTDKTKQIFYKPSPDQQFLTIWSTYPIKVEDGRGGYRVLKSKSESSEQFKTVRDKYKKALKKTNHETILKGLEGYLYTMRNKMQFVVGIEVFFNQSLWERYLETIEQPLEKTQSI